jgi:pimeloyl-ACP methyl ester carboxylesterase
LLTAPYNYANIVLQSYIVTFANMNLSQRLGIAYIQTKLKTIAFISKRKAAEEAFELFCTPMIKCKRNGEPKDAEPLTFTINNITIKGHRWNHPGQKKALLLHGFNSAAYKFDSYAALLVSKGYEVLSFDAAAHGHSGGITTNALEYSQMIQQVTALYGPIDSYISHSFGGIGLSLAMENIAHDACTKIVFIAPATETSSAIDGALAFLKIKNNAIRTAFDDIIFKMSGKQTEWFSVRRAVKNISAQILWLHDEDDTVTPLKDALQVKADNYPNISFMITKGLGHSKIYRDAAVKKAIADFL